MCSTPGVPQHTGMVCRKGSKPLGSGPTTHFKFSFRGRRLDTFGLYLLGRGKFPEWLDWSGFLPTSATSLAEMRDYLKTHRIQFQEREDRGDDCAYRTVAGVKVIGRTHVASLICQCLNSLTQQMNLSGKGGALRPLPPLRTEKGSTHTWCRKAVPKSGGTGPNYGLTPYTS